MSDFLKGTSVLVSLPTLLYVGLAQRRNRLGLLRSNSLASAEMKNFLSLPYEFLPVAISLVYGIVFHVLRKKSKSDESGEAPRNILPVLVAGFLTGLFLSLVGRFGLSLPTKMFGMPPGRSYVVHLVAPVLYAVIFGVHVNYLLKI